MKVSLNLQDPGISSRYTLDVIGNAAAGAKKGVGLFAFATEAGVDLLLDHPSIQQLTKTGTLELIIGIDAITNRETLERLLSVARQRQGLVPRVFWNVSDGLFHPKIFWFSNNNHHSLVIGSGNLTPRGLRDNYEACAVLMGSQRELGSVTEVLRSFLSAHKQHIREIDEEVLERASKNTFGKPVAVIEPPLTRQLARGRFPHSASTARVLVAELPRGGSRWQQANFDFKTALEFFEVAPYDNSLTAELLLNQVDAAGVPTSQETRRFTFTQSKNLRVQLGAHPGATYPRFGRPIAVFRRVKPRHFLYRVLLPGDSGFQTLRALLATHSTDDVRRMITTARELRNAWSSCPLC